MIRVQNFVNGENVAPAGGDYLPCYEPATGQPYCEVSDSTSIDVETAVDAAQSARKEWSSRSGGERARVLMRIADLLEARLEEFAIAESKDTGKPLSLASTVDIPRAVANFRFFAGAGEHFASESHGMGDQGFNYTIRQPLGVAACISPWNLPLYLFTWKIAPALAAGNTVIGKPSELTPMTASMLGQICNDAGLPRGVLNILHGRGASVGKDLTSHPDIAAISFTGGTETGRDVALAAAPAFKKVSLELGGKNPSIVFSDCDYPEMLRTTIRSSMSNQGQICLCSSRILIQKTLYPKFRDDFVSRIEALTVGDPLSPQSDIGALVSSTHLRKVLGHVELARKEGGKILCGGNPVRIDGRCEDGWFMAPTVIEGLSNTCATNQEEIFGPVVTLQPFDDEEDALRLANESRFGLAATLWTNNLQRVNRLTADLQAGIVWVNCWMMRDLRTPFGGMKTSGLGREGGLEALRFFTEPRNICIKTRFDD